MEKLTQLEFNELMQSAYGTKRIYPNMRTEDIVTMVCAKYQGRPDYYEITFQVAYNLVNSGR